MNGHAYENATLLNLVLNVLLRIINSLLMIKYHWSVQEGIIQGKNKHWRKNINSKIQRVRSSAWTGYFFKGLLLSAAMQISLFQNVTISNKTVL